MISRWIGFTGALCGGMYVFLIVGVTVHEILGHGLAALLVGGNFHSFSILPGGGGWAWTSEVGELRWIVTWAGIAVNLLFGLLGLAVLLLRKRPLGAGRLALFLFAVTQLGSALQYPLEQIL